MDQFHDGQHVRLRSRLHRHHTYLHADEDGHGVSLQPHRASMNAAWAAHLFLHENEQYLLLGSAAYGGYLAATGAPSPFGHGGLRVEQRNYDHPGVMATVWSAIAAAGDHVLLRHITRGCLRANRMNGYIHLNNGVSVEGINDIADTTRMMHWIVEPIPAREDMPPLPPSIESTRSCGTRMSMQSRVMPEPGLLGVLLTSSQVSAASDTMTLEPRPFF